MYAYCTRPLQPWPRNYRNTSYTSHEIHVSCTIQHVFRCGLALRISALRTCSDVAPISQVRPFEGPMKFHTSISRVLPGGVHAWALTLVCKGPVVFMARSACVCHVLPAQRPAQQTRAHVETGFTFQQCRLPGGVTRFNGTCHLTLHLHRLSYPELWHMPAPPDVRN